LDAQKAEEKEFQSLVDVLIHYDVNSSQFFEPDKLEKCVQALIEIWKSKESLPEEAKTLEDDFA
jgi:hypothetical protein